MDRSGFGWNGIVLLCFFVLLILVQSTEDLFAQKAAFQKDGKDSRLSAQSLVALKNQNLAWNVSWIKTLSTTSAYSNDTVVIHGWGFGSVKGTVVLSGLNIAPDSWSEKKISFTVPADGYSGPLYIRDDSFKKSNKTAFTVLRKLPDEQYEPYNAELVDTGLLGPAFLVETDGDYLYCLSGFETLSTYRIVEQGPHEFCGRIYLPQRVGELKVLDGYLYCAGDHGLYIYNCKDLHSGYSNWIAAVGDGAYFSVYVKNVGGNPVPGFLVALCEHRPKIGSDKLRISLYQFQSEELLKLGVVARTVGPDERQVSIAIDPLNPKIYVSGTNDFWASGAYLLEFDISDPYNPMLNHNKFLGDYLIYDMDAKNDILWTSATFPQNDSFRAYKLFSGPNFLKQEFALATKTSTNRLKIMSDNVMVGSAWFGSDPNLFIWNTFNPISFPAPAVNTIDWAFDVTGIAKPFGNYDGRLFVADEWSGFLTYYFKEAPVLSIHHANDYHQVPSSAKSEGLYIKDNRIYVVG